MFETKNLLIGILFGALVLAWGAERLKRFDVQREFSQYQLTIETSLRKASEAARSEESRREDAQRKVVQDAQAKTNQAVRNAASANAAAVSLREQLARYTAPASKDPATPGASDAEDPRVGVLADMLGRADERAGIYAQEADSLRISGDACKAAYESLGR